MQAVRAALSHVERVVVLEKSLAVGLGGIVTTDVRMAVAGLKLRGTTVIAGLGGRAITKASLHVTLGKALADQLEDLTFMDLDWNIVNRQLARERSAGRSGPAAESMLRDIGSVASRVH